MQEEKILIEKVIGGNDYHITSFNICPSFFEDEDYFDKMHREELLNKYHDMIQSSDFFLLSRFNKYKEEHELTSNQCRRILEYAIKMLGNVYDFLEIWSATCEYFNVKPEKFYTSMKNKDRKILYTLLSKKRHK